MVERWIIIHDLIRVGSSNPTLLEEKKMKVCWKYWPNRIGETQDDPECYSEYVPDMSAVVKKIANLKSTYGKNLGVVTVTIILHDGA